MAGLRVALFFGEGTEPETVHTIVVDERFYGNHLRRIVVDTYNGQKMEWEPVTILPLYSHGTGLHTICRLNDNGVDRVAW